MSRAIGDWQYNTNPRIGPLEQVTKKNIDKKKWGGRRRGSPVYDWVEIAVTAEPSLQEPFKSVPWHMPTAWLYVCACTCLSGVSKHLGTGDGAAGHHTRYCGEGRSTPHRLRRHRANPLLLFLFLLLLFNFSSFATASCEPCIYNSRAMGAWLYHVSIFIRA